MSERSVEGSGESLPVLTRFPNYGDRRGEIVLPGRIGRLLELAYNLWWSWNEDGRQVFRSLDYAQWRASGHNPVRQLREMNPDQLRGAATDPAFLELYDSVMLQFDADMSGDRTWYFRERPISINGPVAYFSAEFAIHGSLPIYAGGLGVLAGDTCKEASDLGLPLVAVGFMYPQGYFRQRISAEGWQQEVYTQINFYETPVSPCAWPSACGPLIPVPLADREIYVSVWLARVGRVHLYLLDTNVEQNAPQDRTLAARLYTAEPEERIRQLIVLGTGGVRALRALGLSPSVWHGNEDHTSFMMLERLREEREKGFSLEQAVDRVRATTVFTTHTPVAAGHNVFAVDLMERYSHNFWEPLGIDKDRFLRLGQHEGLEPNRFSMTAFALRLSGHSNAVSKLHGAVTRRMWHVLWPERREEETPILGVTNGVHLPTWQAPEFKRLCEKHLGPEFRQGQEVRDSWRCVADIPDEEFWEVRKVLKTRLIRSVQGRAQQRWAEETVPTQQVLAMGTLLDPYTLTIAFTRRFAEYKRPDLILHDRERLKRILTHPLRPVQIVFAGKSHPADMASKRLVNKVYILAMDRSFQGRIAFVEDFDLHLARDLVRGADVWLNNPRRLQEACGTSGMKASMNGGLNPSVRDGWWDEGYSGTNGWAIDRFKEGSSDEEDAADAEALYSLLENEIVPMYYDRDRAGIPHRWIQFSKEAIRTVSPAFSATRMLKEYTERLYASAASTGNGEPEAF